MFRSTHRFSHFSLRTLDTHRHATLRLGRVIEARRLGVGPPAGNYVSLETIDGLPTTGSGKVIFGHGEHAYTPPSTEQWGVANDLMTICVMAGSLLLPEYRDDVAALAQQLWLTDQADVPSNAQPALY